MLTSPLSFLSLFHLFKSFRFEKDQRAEAWFPKPHEKQPLWSSVDALKSNQTLRRRRIKVDWGTIWQIQCVWHSCSMFPLLSKELLKAQSDTPPIQFFQYQTFEPLRASEVLQRVCCFLFHREEWLWSAARHLQSIAKLSWMKNESKR